jgi:hypothetical protein
VDNNHHRAPGSQKEESILVAATAFLFAEGVETGTLIGATCGRVLHPAESRRIGDQGCSTRLEEGSHLSPFVGTACEREGRSFSRVSSTHASTSPSHQPSSAQPTVEFGVPPRTRCNEERWSLALHCRAVLHRSGKVPSVLRGSLARLSIER